MSNTIDKYLLSKLPTRVHLSRDNITKLRNVKQSSKSYKPNGIYYSKQSEWLHFAKNELGYDNIKFTNQYVYINNKKLLTLLYKVTIPTQYKIKTLNNVDKNKIIIIDSFKKVKLFTHKYSVVNNGHVYINWNKVSNDYAGIEFNNYHNIAKMLRAAKNTNPLDYHKNRWLLSFDVNGGCIWNTNNITITYIEPTKTVYI